MKLVGISVLLIFLLNSCNGPKEGSTRLDRDISSIKQIKLNVKSTLMLDIPFQNEIISNGVINAIHKTDLRFKINERIDKIYVKNGQYVRKGDLLASLDDSRLSNELNKALIDFNKAKNLLEIQKINYGVGSIPNEKIDPKVLKNIKINSEYFESENLYKSAKLKYSYSKLRSPFDGLVANIEVYNYDYVKDGDIFCKIIDQENLEVIFSVLETEISSIKINQKIEIKKFEPESKIYRGLITEINPIVDKNGLVKVRAKIIDTNDSLIFEGMNVKVTIKEQLTDISNIYVIPKEALVLRSNKEVVFTLINGHAKWNNVEVVSENSNYYAIRSNLKKTDTIIIAGNLNLSHNAEVHSTFIKQ